MVLHTPRKKNGKERKKYLLASTTCSSPIPQKGNGGSQGKSPLSLSRNIELPLLPSAQTRTYHLSTCRIHHQRGADRMLRLEAESAMTFTESEFSLLVVL